VIPPKDFILGRIPMEKMSCFYHIGRKTQIIPKLIITNNKIEYSYRNANTMKAIWMILIIP
jgi:hypothetical protein